MKGKTKFIFILLVFLVFNVAVVSANEMNTTDFDALDNDSEEIPLEQTDMDLNSSEITNETTLGNETEIVKTNPKITLKSNKVKSKDTIEIILKNSSGSPLASKKIHTVINNKKLDIRTNSKGVAKLNVNLAAKTYKLTVSFDGDKLSNNITKKFNVKVSKLSTSIVTFTNFVVRKHSLYFYLYDQNGNHVSGKKIILKFKGKTYTKTANKNGRVGIKIKSYISKYSIKAKFKGDNQFKSASKSLKFYVTSSMSLKIANSKLLTGGYLRIYLKTPYKYGMSKKTLKITVGGKKFTKKITSEGIVVIKPKLAAKKYTVSVKFGKYRVSKKIRCIEGKVKDPLKESIALKNGVPDIDVMPGNYVMGDGSATYTLTKSQYLSVIKRDSYCLFLNNKLSKYTFFKTKNHPNTYHILKREKWNVIERAVNLKIVAKNKNGYWPGTISVSLKGKSYTYPEVRDSQGTGYTCGPTSASVCSQVLRNYYCEKYLAKKMGTNYKDGTKCAWMVSALGKLNFNCTYFYKASFNNALNELKTGGAALIFHANRHYVSILDISKDGKKVLVSNSYGSYDNIPTKWIKVSYMKNKFSHWEESLIVKLNYKLNNSTKNSVNAFYHSMGTNWIRQNTHEGLIK